MIPVTILALYHIRKPMENLPTKLNQQLAQCPEKVQGQFMDRKAKMDPLTDPAGLLFQKLEYKDSY